jgi:hypothetical protein
MTVALRGKARDKLREDLATRYNEGASIRSLIRLSGGRSYGFVHRLLGEAGVEIRPRSQPRTHQ